MRQDRAVALVLFFFSLRTYKWIPLVAILRQSTASFYSYFSNTGVKKISSWKYRKWTGRDLNFLNSYKICQKHDDKLQIILSIS